MYLIDFVNKLFFFFRPPLAVNFFEGAFPDSKSWTGGVNKRYWTGGDIWRPNPGGGGSMYVLKQYNSFF